LAIESVLQYTPGVQTGSDTIFLNSVETIFGSVMCGVSHRGLALVHLTGADNHLTCEATLDAARRYFPSARLLPAEAAPSTAISLLQSVGRHISIGSTTKDIPLDLSGTPFQRAVWEYLQSIPCGETQTYQQVAQAIGRPSAVRAVANACASNRLALLVPCHRVTRSDGALGGYRWGSSLKSSLLQRERELVSEYRLR
jgi:AraC family transcriptional regulator of adaptative response/methylated-DNA-[protein]-cysteine methyltransferase